MVVLGPEIMHLEAAIGRQTHPASTTHLMEQNPVMPSVPIRVVRVIDENLHLLDVQRPIKPSRHPSSELASLALSARRQRPMRAEPIHREGARETRAE